jgi:putative endopeptidase
MDPHSPDEFRANGAAMNSDAFHEAYATQPGDRMYKPAEQRIRLW